MKRFILATGCVAAFMFFVLGVGPITATLWALPITAVLKIGHKMLP